MPWLIALIAILALALFALLILFLVFRKTFYTTEKSRKSVDPYQMPRGFGEPDPVMIGLIRDLIGKLLVGRTEPKLILNCGGCVRMCCGNKDVLFGNTGCIAYALSHSICIFVVEAEHVH